MSADETPLLFPASWALTDSTRWATKAAREMPGPGIGPGPRPGPDPRDSLRLAIALASSATMSLMRASQVPMSFPSRSELKYGGDDPLEVLPIGFVILREGQ